MQLSSNTIESIRLGKNGPFMVRVSFSKDIIIQNQKLKKKNSKRIFLNIHDVENKIMAYICDKLYEKLSDSLQDGDFLKIHKCQSQDLRINQNIICIIEAEKVQAQDYLESSNSTTDRSLIDRLFEEDLKKNKKEERKFESQTQLTQVCLVPTNEPSQYIIEKPILSKVESEDSNGSSVENPTYKIPEKKNSPIPKVNVPEKYTTSDVFNKLKGLNKTPETSPKSTIIPKENLSTNQKKADSPVMMPPSKYTPPKMPFMRTTPKKDIDSDSLYYPISKLSCSDQNWMIKVRIFAKSNVINFKKKDGNDGCLFTINLIDIDGNEISAVFFGAQLVAKYSHEIEVGKIYLLSGGVVKENSKRYGTSKNDNQIVFDNRSHIFLKEEPNDPKIPRSAFEFARFDEINSMASGTSVDVIGIVIKVCQIESLNIGDNRVVPIRKIELYDNSKRVIQTTLWDYKSALTFELYEIILIKGAKVKEYEGKKTLAVNANTEIVKNSLPSVAHARKFLAWHKNLTKEELNQVAGIATEIDQNTVVIDEIDASISKINTEYYIRAHIAYISTGKPPENLCDDCKRSNFNRSPMKKQPEIKSPIKTDQDKLEPKEFQEEIQEIKCVRCGNLYKQSLPRQAVQIRASDHTGIINLTGFGKIADQILNEKAKFMAQQTNMNLYSDCIYHEYKIKIKYVGEYQEQKKFIIQKMTKVDYIKESLDILANLHRYQPSDFEKINDLYDIF